MCFLYLFFSAPTASTVKISNYKCCFILFIVTHKSIADCKIQFNPLHCEGCARKDTVIDLCNDSVLSYDKRRFTNLIKKKERVKQFTF